MNYSAFVSIEKNNDITLEDGMGNLSRDEPIKQLRKIGRTVKWLTI